MITGGLPETGFRVVLERAREDDTAPCTYRGRLELPDGSHALTVDVDAALAVTVHLPAEPAALGALTDKVRLLVRQVVKESARDGAALARKIVRWRGEK